MEISATTIHFAYGCLPKVEKLTALDFVYYQKQRTDCFILNF
jgi:hypothetical protein